MELKGKAKFLIMEVYKDGLDYENIKPEEIEILELKEVDNGEYMVVFKVNNPNVDETEKSGEIYMTKDGSYIDGYLSSEVEVE